MRRVHRLWRMLCVLCLSTLLAGSLGGVAVAQGPQGDDRSLSLEERVVRDAAAALGWPTTVEKKPLRASNTADETLMMLWPPYNAVRYYNKPMYTATNGGSYEDETIRWLRVLPMGEQGSRDFIDTMLENGLPHSSYQGREGIVMRAGEQICNPGGLLGFLMEQIRKWIVAFVESLGLDSEGVIEDSCAEAAAGVIMWTCGSHIFIARDDTGQGAEDTIAAALWMAAERNSICDIGDTVVLLAGTADRPNTKTIADAQKLAQDTNSYFGQNAYGRVVLGYTFLDADGNTGNADGYEVGPTIAAYAGLECDFAQDAVRKAFEGGAPREELNLARVIVVYSGPSKQADSTNGRFSTLCCWPENGMYYEIEVGPAGDRSTVFASNLVMVAEEDGLGLWAHEVGHTLYSRHTLYSAHPTVRPINRISDRYNYDQPWGKYGDINAWGLMGSGNWWGDPRASSPVHMSGFTKESAGWLTYVDGELDQEYSLTAVERQQAGGTVLRIDDPNSNNPNHFFVVEARDSTTAYGAPESGVVIYQVTWEAHAWNPHHVVNVLSPQQGSTTGTARNRQYRRPTLRGVGSAGAPTSWKSPSHRLDFQLIRESTANGYSATVRVVEYDPANLVGAVAAPAGPPAVPQNAAPPNPVVGSAPRERAALTGRDLPLPDIDLHAHDDQGRHVGLNYQTGEYENQIPGAIASGDLKDAQEWIYVPEGAKVRFEISAYKTAQFLQNSPEYRDVIRPQEFQMTYQRIDENGVITAAKGESGKIEAGKVASTKGPDAPGLQYKPLRAPGYGRNLPANLWWSGLLLALGIMFVVGWIVALARR